MRAARERNKGLAKAVRHFKERKYLETIRLLEPQVFTYRENPVFYHLLGVSCLQTGDFAGAYSYLKRAVQLEPMRTDSLLGLAVVHLRRNETQECLRIWLQILEDDPNNRAAKRGLEAIKNNAANEGFDDFFESGAHKSLIPSTGFFLPKPVKIAGAVVVLAMLFTAGALLLRSQFQNKKESTRPEIAVVTIEKDDVVLDPDGKAAYMMSDKEIRDSFLSIKELFEKYEDNFARREINRLLLSNAARTVKDKIRLFLPYIRTPNFASFTESFSYKDVMASPLLYEGCFVRWKGRISNIRVSDKEIAYDFLAGYQDQKVLQGVVPARMGFAAKLDPAFAYEIIGKIVPRGEKAISLDVVSIHELGL